jgi:hypothetical protein
MEATGHEEEDTFKNKARSDKIRPALARSRTRQSRGSK